MGRIHIDHEIILILRRSTLGSLEFHTKIIIIITFIYIQNKSQIERTNAKGKGENPVQAKKKT